MTDGYTSEEEQVEQIKQWWKENGASVLTGAGIGIAAILGWQYYQSKTTSEAEYASAVYDSIATQTAADDASAETAKLVAELKQSYGATPYAVLGAFADAKTAVEAENFAQAETSLQWVIDNSKQTELVHLATWRLARVQLALGKLDEASKTITTGRIPVGFEVNYAELRGDILVAQSNLAEAATAYEEALKLADGDYQRKQQIQTKLDSVN